MIASRTEKKYTEHYMWSTPHKEMITMWSEKTSSKEKRTASSFFCRCCIVTYKIVIVKAPFAINSAFKI